MNDLEFRNPEDNAWCEPDPVTDAAEADTKHVQGVLDRHAAGRLVTVLECNEQYDGATWTVLARDNGGNLVRCEICDEPNYSDVEVTATY